MRLARLRAAPSEALRRAGPPIQRRRYRKGLRDFHRGLVSPGDLVFDVGANVGDYTEAFLALDAHVLAIEPDGGARDELERRFGRERRVTVLAEGVADEEGPRQLSITEGGGSTLTTLSLEWLQAMQRSGRFAHLEWRPGPSVEMTTLDALIAEYGLPGFIKVDVEGLELPVVRGLSRPVPGLSLETSPEHRGPTMEAVEHLTTLGDAEFAYAPGVQVHALGESRPGDPGGWGSPERLEERLRSCGPEEFGDVLVRFPAARREGHGKAADRSNLTGSGKASG